MICGTIALFWLCTNSVSEFTDISGIAKKKKKNLQNQLVLKVCTPLLLWKRKTNKQTTFFLVSVMPACSYMNSPDMLSSSFRVYYVESHDMNVHLVKVRYE